MSSYRTEILRPSESGSWTLSTTPSMADSTNTPMTLSPGLNLDTEHLLDRGELLLEHDELLESRPVLIGPSVGAADHVLVVPELVAGQLLRDDARRHGPLTRAAEEGEHLLPDAVLHQT